MGLSPLALSRRFVHCAEWVLKSPRTNIRWDECTCSSWCHPSTHRLRDAAIKSNLAAQNWQRGPIRLPQTPSLAETWEQGKPFSTPVQNMAAVPSFDPNHQGWFGTQYRSATITRATDHHASKSFEFIYFVVSDLNVLIWASLPRCSNLQYWHSAPARLVCDISLNSELCVVTL